jgi:hypothetical protein
MELSWMMQRAKMGSSRNWRALLWLTLEQIEGRGKSPGRVQIDLLSCAVPRIGRCCRDVIPIEWERSTQRPHPGGYDIADGTIRWGPEQMLIN